MSKLPFDQKKMNRFIGMRMSGASITIKKHKERAMIISTAIYGRFGVHAYQYQQKHWIWFITEYISCFAPSTGYNYYLTMIKIINLSPKYLHWENALKKQYKEVENERQISEMIGNLVF